MARVVFLSPHLDDVALSCGALLQRLHVREVDTLVVNVFDQATPISEESRALYERRRQEDERALNFFGVRRMSLGFLDAPFRATVRGRNGRVLFGTPTCEPETLLEITTAIHKLVVFEKPDVVVAPLGVGWHLDHLLVHEAAVRSCDVQSLRFYSDRPYSMVDGQTELRAGLTGHSDVESYYGALLNAPYVRSFLPHWRRADFEALLREQLEIETGRRFRRSLSLSFSSAEANLAGRAIAAYVTQCDQLFGSDTDLEALLKSSGEIYFKIDRPSRRAVAP